MDELLTRRGTLLRLAGFVAAGLGTEASHAGEGPAGVASGSVSCVLAPEQTEGPYYIANEKIRRNITDGRRGVPLTLRARVVDASTCKPIKTTRNADDFVFANGGKNSLLSVRSDGADGYIAAITMGVVRS